MTYQKKIKYSHTICRVHQRSIKCIDFKRLFLLCYKNYAYFLTFRLLKKLKVLGCDFYTNEFVLKFGNTKSSNILSFIHSERKITSMSKVFLIRNVISNNTLVSETRQPPGKNVNHCSKNQLKVASVEKIIFKSSLVDYTELY